MNSADDLAAVALLAEPVRLALYRYVRAKHEPVGRVEAAGAVGISVALAAFHLDRLVEAEMLEVGFARLSGRTGPGAGRPAKLYTFSKQPLAVTFPQTRYSLAASIMATALEGGHGGSDGSGGAAGVQEVAESVGHELGVEILREAPNMGDRQRALFRRLEQLGYEPRQDGAQLSLRNCIFADLAQDHRDLVCGMNGALLRGLLVGADLRDLQIEGRPPEPGCCACIVDGSGTKGLLPT